MKSDWQTVKLGDIITFQRGYDLPKSQMIKGIYPVIGSNGVIGYHNKYTTNSPCITVGRSGNVGTPFICHSKAWAHNTSLYIKDFKGVFPLYIYYLLKILNLRNYAGGSAVPTLNRNHINQIVLNIPIRISEQKAIADTLSALDDKIELNNKINKNLEEMAQAIFKSWFVDFEPFKDGEFVDSKLGRIPKGFRVGKFENIIMSTLGGDWGKETATGNYSQEVYCIRGADIPEVNKGNKGKMPIRYILEKNYSSKKLEDSDLVVEISGGSPTQSTGRICLITKALLDRYNKGMVCTNFCRALKPYKNYSKFINLYWKYLYSINTMFSYENGTTGIKNFDLTGFITSELIIIPPENVLLKFNNMLDSNINIIFNNGMENEKLSTLRDTLLPKLMSGEIRVPYKD